MNHACVFESSTKLKNVFHIWDFVLELSASLFLFLAFYTVHFVYFFYINTHRRVIACMYFFLNKNDFKIDTHAQPSHIYSSYIFVCVCSYTLKSYKLQSYFEFKFTFSLFIGRPGQEAEAKNIKAKILCSQRINFTHTLPTTQPYHQIESSHDDVMCSSEWESERGERWKTSGDF